MHGDLIAFDLETTGLDPASAEIIEIGMARFRDGEIVEQFQSLVKPSVPIPSDITHLTGIHQEDVEDAPAIDALLPRLREFFGDAPIVAHNASFDVSFMNKHHLLESNPAIDTFEFSAIILPSAPRYSLSSLANHMGIALTGAHRAFNDAVATGHLYWKLWEKTCLLPSSILSEIIQASDGKSWQLRPVFQAALNENLQRGIAARPSIPFVAENLTAQPLDMSQASRDPLPALAVEQKMGASGDLPTVLGSYEPREQQLTMALDVTSALNQGEQAMIEAGTGTGKSLAYLIPAALWAVQNGQRVTVSTYTINLQEQLLNKDIPLARRVVGDKLQAALMKGRGNYLCPRRLETMRRRKPASLDELRTMAKLLVWLQSSGSGDRGELTLRAGEWSVWSRLSAQDEGCSTFRCASEMGGICPYYRARKKAETAHLLITNHALLIADARIENRALPAYHNLIVDEAHHLEDAITDGLSRRIDQPLILARLRDLGNVKGGTLGTFLSAARDHVPKDETSKLKAFIQNIDDAVEAMRWHIRNYFRSLYDFAANLNKNNNYAVRLLNSHRDSSGFAAVQRAWKQLATFFLAVTDAMEHLCATLPRYEEYQLPDFGEYSGEIKSHWRFLAELHEQLERFTEQPDSNAVYGLTAGNRAEQLQLHISPLHVGPMMEEYLNQRMESIVLTSATLRTQGNFDHIKERLYTDDFKTIALGSPFDYKASTLLYVPDDMPEPNQRNEYQKSS